MAGTRKAPLLQASFTYPLVTLVLLAAAFLLYYVLYTTRHEATLDARAFRGLAAASDGVQSRMQALATVFGQATAAKELDKSLETMTAYLATQAPNLKISTASVPAVPCPDAQSVTIRSVERAANHFIEFSCGGWSARVPMRDVAADYLQITPADAFDDVLIADDGGLVLYQPSGTGNRISRLPRVRPAAGATGDGKEPAPAEFPTVSHYSSFSTVDLAGKPHRLYVVPVEIQLSAADRPDDRRMLVAGLITESRFQSRTRTVPAPALVTLVLLVLVVIVAAWPLLKFGTMRATDPIHRRSLLYFFGLTLATIVIVSVLAIHLRYISNPVVFNASIIDEHLKSLSTAIERNVTTELKYALEILDSADRRLTEVNLGRDVPCGTGSPPGVSRCNLLASPGFGLTNYPYFDRVIWMGADRKQYAKWEVGRTSTLAIDVSDREYYTQTVAGKLWQLTGTDDTRTRFRVDPVVSRNTGEYTAVISRVAQPVTPSTTRVPIAVVSLVTPMLSLIEPVMPPDYGFAVVDETGKVLFHSTASRNGRENFLDEVEQGDALRVALFSGQETRLTATYLGATHRMRVSRFHGIEPSPWSIIAFHNLTEDDSESLDRILLFAALALIYPALIIALFARWAGRGSPRSWIWPNERTTTVYLQLTVAFAMATGLSYLLIFQSDRLITTFATAFLAPAVMALVGFLKLRGAGRRRLGAVLLLSSSAYVYALPWGTGPFIQLALIGITVCAAAGFVLIPEESLRPHVTRRVSLSSAYSALFASALMLAGLLPCVAFFTVAYNYRHDLAIRREQLQVIAALKRREEKVKARYQSVTLSRSDEEAKSDVSKWLFVRRRLDESLDRYDSAALHGKARIFEPADSSAPAGGCAESLPPAFVALASLVPFSTGTLANSIRDSLLIADADARNTWVWCLDASNRIRLAPKSDPLGPKGTAAASIPARALYKAVTADPVFLYPEVVSDRERLQMWNLFWALVVFLGGSAATFLWVRPTLRHMFLLAVRDVAVLPELDLQTVLRDCSNHTDPLRKPNTILLTHAPATARAAAHSAAGVFVVDGRDIARGFRIHWGAVVASILVIVNPEGSDEQEPSQKLLELLEDAASQDPARCIVIVTSRDLAFQVNPAATLSHETGYAATAEGLRDRWNRALAGFRRARMPGYGLAAVEAQWLASTPSERVALYQLAQDRWVNARNSAALVELQERGLIHGRPFAFVQPALGDFVLTIVGPDDRRMWRAIEGVSLWDGLRLVLIMLLAGAGAAVLFFNQQSVLGLVATGVGVLTPFTKLLSEARSVRALFSRRENS
jgi:hypothetical protein